MQFPASTSISTVHALLDDALKHLTPLTHATEALDDKFQDMWDEIRRSRAAEDYACRTQLFQTWKQRIVCTRAVQVYANRAHARRCHRLFRAWKHHMERCRTVRHKFMVSLQTKRQQQLHNWLALATRNKQGRLKQKQAQDRDLRVRFQTWRATAQRSRLVRERAHHATQQHMRQWLRRWQVNIAIVKKTTLYVAPCSSYGSTGANPSGLFAMASNDKDGCNDTNNNRNETARLPSSRSMLGHVAATGQGDEIYDEATSSDGPRVLAQLEGICRSTKDVIAPCGMAKWDGWYLGRWIVSVAYGGTNRPVFVSTCGLNRIPSLGWLVLRASTYCTSHSILLDGYDTFNFLSFHKYRDSVAFKCDVVLSRRYDIYIMNTIMLGVCSESKYPGKTNILLR